MMSVSLHLHGIIWGRMKGAWVPEIYIRSERVTKRVIVEHAVKQRNDEKKKSNIQ